jgi:DNA-binding PucR family transcriptional regulator
VSPPVRGLARLDVAHRWARLAAGTLPAGRGAAAGLDDRLPEALLAEAPDLAPRLRRAALGGVLDLPESERRSLIDTLRAVLDAGGSPSRAASALYCHRNTVMYRLARLEALTGRSLSDARDRLLLGLALTLPPGESSEH